MTDEHEEPKVPIDPREVPPPPPPAPADDATAVIPAAVSVVPEPVPPTPPPAEAPQPFSPAPAPPPPYAAEQEFLQQPYAEQPATGPSAMALTWRALWEAPLKTWRGRPLDALEQVHAVKEKTGNPWIVWVTMMVLNSILMALTVTALIARGSDFLYQPLRHGFAGYGMSFGVGQMLLVFLLMTIIIALSLAARGAGLYLTQRVAGATVGFQRAVTSYAASHMLYTLPLAVVAILTLLGAMGTVWLPVAVAAAGLGIMVQVFNYIAVLRDGPHRFSPLVPFAWFAVLAAVVSAGLRGMVLTALL